MGDPCLQRLPQFPLPTHEVIVRYFPPAEFEVLRCYISYSNMSMLSIFMYILIIYVFHAATYSCL